MKHHPLSLRAALALGVLTFAITTPHSAFSAVTSWNVPSGDWTAGGNWTAGAPDAVTGADIDNSGTATLTGVGNANPFNLGLNTGSNGLVINSGSLGSVSTTVGSGGSSNNNSVLVTGTGTWNNTGLILIGGSGGGNSITVSGSSHVITGGMEIGSGSSSNNNTGIVSGSSQILITNLLFVGGNGSGNTLTVSDFSVLNSGGGAVGNGANSNNNSLTLNSNSVWTSTGAVYVGGSGTNNTLTLNNSLLNMGSGNSLDIGHDAGSDFNTLLATGGSTKVNFATVITVGQGGSNNSLIVSNGATVSDARGLISGSTTSNNNTALVTGTGSLWTNSDLLFVGNSGTGNVLNIMNGGQVTVTASPTVDSSFIGYNLGADHNVVNVTGGTFSNSAQLTIGNFGSNNALNITAGGVVSDTNGLVAFRANSTGNSVLVDGAGSQWNNSGFLYIGRQGNSNSLTISNGGVVTVSGTDPSGFSSAIGNKGTAAGNSVLVTTGGAWNNTFGLAIGETTSGTGNSLTVSNGGSVSASFILIAGGAGSTGTLNIGEGGAAGTVSTGTITGGAGTAVVNFKHTGTLNFSPVLAGSISLNKSGAGTTVLTAINTYTGSTIVNGGMLQVDGAIASPNTQVNFGGGISGAGTIGGNLVSDGLVSPGGAPGTLSVTGNYTQQSNGSLAIQIASAGTGQHDVLAVGGSTALAGNVEFTRVNGGLLHVGDQIVFLTSGTGVSGTFATVQNHLNSILQTNVIYESNDVLVQLQQGSFAAFAVGLTPNQQSVARNLDIAAGDPRAGGLLDFLNNQPLGNLAGDFDLIAPDELTSIFEIGRAFADVQGSNIENRLAEVRAENSEGANVLALYDGGKNADASKEKTWAPQSSRAGNRWDIFLAGSGDFVRIQGDGNGAGYNFNTGGVTLGADYRVNDKFVVGILGGYANTGATLAQGGSVDVNSGKIGVYSTLYNRGFYVNTMAAGGYNSYDTHRAGLGGIAQGSTEGAEFDGLISGGYELHEGNFTLGPVATAQYTYVSINGFDEAGSLAPLHVESQNQESFRTKVGFKIAYAWKAGNGVLVTPTVSAGWQHEFLDDSFALDSRFANGSGNVFTVNGPKLGRDSVVVNAGVNVQWNERLGTFLSYDGELGRKNYQLHSVSGGVKVSF